MIEDKQSPSYFSTFYLRRTFRIFPLYYLVLALWFIVFPLLWPAHSENVWQQHHQVWFWLYIQNWAQGFGREVGYLSHFWSLAIEEQFYLFWPLVVRYLSLRRLSQLCVALFLYREYQVWIVRQVKRKR